MATTINLDYNALPLIRNYTIRQGDCIDDLFTMYFNGAASTLVNVTLTLSVVKSDGTAQVTDRAVTADNAASGLFGLRTTAADSAAWLGRYQYELQGVWAAAHAEFTTAQTKTILAGTINVTADITA